MNKKVVIFLSIFSLSLPLDPASAAVKAGSKCTKVGVKSVVNDKSYVCAKSGKKLLWLESNNKQSLPGLPGGFETNTTYSTDIGFDHKFTSPSGSDPGTPPEWKAMERQYIGDRIGFRFKKYQLGQQRPKSLVTNKVELLAPEACKMPDGTGDVFLRAFPSSNVDFDVFKR